MLIPLSLFAAVNAGFLPYEAPVHQLPIQGLPFEAQAIPADFHGTAFPAQYHGGVGDIHAAAYPDAQLQAYPVHAAAPVQHVQHVQHLPQPVVSLQKTIVKHVQVCIVSKCILIGFHCDCSR